MKHYIYEELAKYYDLFFPLDKSDKKLVLFILNLAKGKALLDIGCGTGAFDELLTRKFNINGIDNSKGMLDIAKKKVPKAIFYKKDIKKFKLNEKFDVIVSFGSVFNYFNYSEIERIFANVRKYLKKNGLFVFDIGFNTKSYKPKVWMKKFKNITIKCEQTKTKNNKIFLKFEFKVNNIVYKDKHLHYLFDIYKVKNILEKIGFNTEIYDREKLIKFSKKSEWPLFICRLKP